MAQENMMRNVSRKALTESTDHPSITGISAFPTKRIVLFFVAAVVFVSLVVYFNALFDGFAYDDNYQIVQNHWIEDITYLPKIFSEGVWGFMGVDKGGNYYRPLMYVSYMIDYALFGRRPWAFHLTNILFHCGVSVLVFLITAKLLRESGIVDQSSEGKKRWWMYSPLIAALLFAAHPVHTEAVTWAAGLPEPAFAFFGLLSLYFYMKRETGLDRNMVLSLFCFSAALLFKETAIMLPLFLVAYDYSFKKGRLLSTDSIKRYAPYLIVCSVYLIVRVHALGGLAPGKRRIELTSWEYFINVFPLFVKYVEKLLAPVNLHGFYFFYPIRSLAEPRGIISFVMAAAFVVFMAVTMKKARPAFFGLVLFIVPLLPVFYIRGLGINTFAERYLYLPSFGFVFLAALILEWVKKKYSRASVFLGLLCFALVGLYAAGTIARNPAWKNTYVFYDDIIAKEPAFASMAMENTVMDAMDYLDKGRLTDAVAALQYVTRLRPDYADAHDKLGIAYERLGLTYPASEEFRIAARLQPASADIRINLGNALFAGGLVDEAIVQYQTALQLNSSLVEAHYNLALAYEQKGAVDEAIRHLEAAIRITPQNPLFIDELRKAYVLKGKGG